MDKEAELHLETAITMSFKIFAFGSSWSFYSEFIFFFFFFFFCGPCQKGLEFYSLGINDGLQPGRPVPIVLVPGGTFELL